MSRPLLLLLALVVPYLQLRVDRALGEFRSQEEILYVHSGEQVKRLCPGFEGLMADVYWLRTVQYFGTHRRERRFELLEPLVNVTVALDPQLSIAYRYGSVFLSEPPPIGAGEPEKGLALLDRGASKNPRDWYLQQLRGFYAYFFLHDSDRAAAGLLEASHLPGAPEWLKTLAADLLAKGGEREKARRLWSSIYAAEDEGPLKKNAHHELLRLDALDEVDSINRSVDEFAAAHGRKPTALSELGLAGRMDPTGVPFDYDAVEGKAQIAKQSTLWRRPGVLQAGLQP